MIYINGIRASKKDVERLNREIKHGGRVTIKRTPSGAISIRTLF